MLHKKDSHGDVAKIRTLHDKFTEVIASKLHQFEQAEKVDLSTASYEEIRQMGDGYITRYMNEPIFHARVKSIVANLLQVVEDHK